MAALTTPTPRVVLGPLTTSFSPPSHCTSLFRQQPPYGPIDVSPFDLSFSDTAVQAVTCDTGPRGPGQLDVSDPLVPLDGPLGFDPMCRPRTTQGAHGSGTNYDWAGIYSPGLMCPEGFAIACSTIGSAAVLLPSIPSVQNFNFQHSILSSEGAAGCCPSGYECFKLLISSVSYQTCLSLAIEGSLTTIECIESGQGTSSTVVLSTSTFTAPLIVTSTSATTQFEVETLTFSSTMTSNLITLPSSLGQRVLYPATAVTSEFRHSTAGALTALPRAVSSKTTSFDETFFYTGTTNSPAVSIFAPLIQINWGPQDAQAISRKLFPASTSSTSDPAQNRSNLPTAAKITIGVVVPIVGLIVFIVAITLLLRLRHRKQQRAGQGKKFEKSELEATNPASGTQKIAPIRELSAAGGLQELGPQQYHEMHVPNVHHELIVPHVVHEIGHSDRAHGTSQV